MTAPLHQAPDADERVGAIVGALAEAKCECGHDAIGAHRTESRGCSMTNCDCSRGPHEALAPTVARLMAQAAEEAVAERLAGVEAVLRRIKRDADEAWTKHCEAADEGDHARGEVAGMVGEMLDDYRQALRAALHPKETDR